MIAGVRKKKDSIKRVLPSDEPEFFATQEPEPDHEFAGEEPRSTPFIILVPMCPQTDSKSENPVSVTALFHFSEKEPFCILFSS